MSDSHDSDPIVAELADGPPPPPIRVRQQRSKKYCARLWLLGWYFGLCGLIGVVITSYVVFKYDGEAVMVGLTGLSIMLGIGLSIAAVVRPERIDGRPLWVAATLGLLGNLFVLMLYFPLVIFYALEDDIEKQAQEQAIAQKKAAEERERGERRRQLLQRQSEFHRERNLRRIREEERKQHLERERVAKEAEQHKLETFASGAVFDLTDDEVVRFRDRPVQDVNEPLYRLHDMKLDNGRVSFYQMPVGKLAPNIDTKRVYALRTPREMIAIDVAEQTVVRRLTLPRDADDLVCTQGGPVLRFGSRVVFCNAELQPLFSAGRYFDKVWGHVRYSHLISVGPNPYSGKAEEQLCSRDLSYALRHPTGRVGRVRPGVTQLGRFQAVDRVATFENHDSDTITNVVTLASENVSLHTIWMEGVSRARGRTTSFPHELAGANGSIHFLNGESVAVRQLDTDSSEARVTACCINSSRFRGSKNSDQRAIAEWTERTISATAETFVSAACERRIYARQSPLTILTWEIYTDRFETFDLSEWEDAGDAYIRRLFALPNEVWAELSNGTWARIEHEDFPANQVERLVALETGVQQTETVAPIMPQVEFIAAEAPIALNEVSLDDFKVVVSPKDHGDFTEYPLVPLLQAGFYDRRQQQLIFQLKEGGDLVWVDPETFAPLVRRKLPRPFDGFRLTTMRSMPILLDYDNGGGYALLHPDGKYITPYQLIHQEAGRNQSGIHYRFARQARLAEWHENDDFTNGFLRLSRDASVQRFTRTEQIASLEQHGIDESALRRHLNVQCVESGDGTIHIYATTLAELFRWRLPTPQTDEPWQAELICRHPERVKWIDPYDNFVVTYAQEPKNRTPPPSYSRTRYSFRVRIYEAKQAGKLLDELSFVDEGINAFGDHFYYQPNINNVKYVVCRNIATGQEVQLPVHHYRVKESCAFPRGILLFETEPRLYRLK